MKKLPVLIFCIVMFASVCLAKDGMAECVTIREPRVEVKKGFPNVFHPFVYLYNKITGNGKRRAIARYFVNVECLELSRTEVVVNSSSDSKKVEVKAGARMSDPSDLITFNYTVTGGKIVGAGDSVIWDLSGVKPGIYFITAAADDGCGVCGNTKTKEVKVLECADCKQ